MKLKERWEKQRRNLTLTVKLTLPICRAMIWKVWVSVWRPQTFNWAVSGEAVLVEESTLCNSNDSVRFTSSDTCHGYSQTISTWHVVCTIELSRWNAIGNSSVFTKDSMAFTVLFFSYYCKNSYSVLMF